MSSIIEEIVHELIDAAAGIRNIPPHRAADLHEQITPGYNDKPVTEEEAAAAQAVLDRLQREADKRAAAAAAVPASGEPVEVPAV